MEQLTRREQLELWRKEKGRTPMKRLSYVQQYCTPNGTVIHPGSRLVGHSIQKCTPSTKSMKEKSTENIPPPPKSTQRKLSRREMLDEWLAIHGSTVKRPRSGSLLKNTKQSMTDTKRVQQKRRTNFSARNPHSNNDQLRLSALREQFQRDIDDTVLAICREESTGMDLTSCQSPDSTSDDHTTDLCGPNLAQALDFDGALEKQSCDNKFDYSESAWQNTGANEEELVPRFVNHSVDSPTILRKKRRRSRMSQVDPNMVFQSMVIKYSMALSEPRRKRRSRHYQPSAATTPDNRRLLHLTPVRRSTRKNRHHCPGISLDQELCFDSPSEAQGREGYEGVELVPNKTLNMNS